jgi:hypothetical protein
MLNMSNATYFRESVDMSMVYFHTKFHIYNSSGSAVVRFRAKYSWWHCLLLHSVSTMKFINTSHIFLRGLLPQKISGSYITHSSVTPTSDVDIMLVLLIVAN